MIQAKVVEGESQSVVLLQGPVPQVLLELLDREIIVPPAEVEHVAVAGVADRQRAQGQAAVAEPAGVADRQVWVEVVEVDMARLVRVPLGGVL